MVGCWTSWNFPTVAIVRLPGARCLVVSCVWWCFVVQMDWDPQRCSGVQVVRLLGWSHVFANRSKRNDTKLQPTVCFCELVHVHVILWLFTMTHREFHGNSTSVKLPSFAKDDTCKAVFAAIEVFTELCNSERLGSSDISKVSKLKVTATKVYLKYIINICIVLTIPPYSSIFNIWIIFKSLNSSDSSPHCQAFRETITLPAHLSIGTKVWSKIRKLPRYYMGILSILGERLWMYCDCSFYPYANVCVLLCSFDLFKKRSKAMEKSTRYLPDLPFPDQDRFLIWRSRKVDVFVLQCQQNLVSIAPIHDIMPLFINIVVV